MLRAVRRERAMKVHQNILLGATVAAFLAGVMQLVIEVFFDTGVPAF